ncbi:MAG: response regulator [Geobacteraceae bacterium]|nr:response regulator [Geobacteraceae bacterium]
MAKKILVVEDNDQNRTLISDVLEYYGYTVVEAMDGADGVAKAREQLPDLILLDIQMPVMNGFTALQALRDDPLMREIRVIALTSFAMKGDRERIMAAGFQGYIAKPIDTRELPKLVEQFLEESQ